MINKTNNGNYITNAVGNKPFIDLKALVVDDDRLNRKVAKIFLEDFGFTTDTANNGGEAISMFNNDNYDLVLLDIGLPDISGWEVCEKIRMKDEDVIIIAWTASGDYFKEKCFDAGVNDYLVKPTPKEDLEISLMQHFKVKE